MIDPKTRATVIERDSSTCQDCGHVGETGNRKGEIQVHHITPSRLGGSGDANNLVSLCVECHGIRDVELRRTRPSKAKPATTQNLNLQITRDLLKAFDAAIGVVHPDVNVRPSRSQAIRAAMLDYVAQSAAPRKRTKGAGS